MGKTKYVALANFKGGTGKTTSSVYLAHSFQGMGLKVLLLDLDLQASATRWGDRGDLDMTIMQLDDKNKKNFHRHLPGILGDRYDVVVIDTPPADGEYKFVTNSMKLADQVVIPTSASYVELEQLWDVVTELEELGKDDDDYCILLTREFVNSADLKIARDDLLKLGRHVLSPAVPYRLQIKRSYMRGLDHMSFGYDLLAKQIWEKVNTND